MAKNMMVENINCRSNTTLHLMTLEDGSVFVLSIAAKGHLDGPAHNTADVLQALALVNGGAAALPAPAPAVPQFIPPAAPKVEMPPAPPTPKVVNKIETPAARPMTDDEMRAAMKEKGKTFRGIHKAKTAKLIEKMTEFGLPIMTNGPKNVETDKPQGGETDKGNPPPASGFKGKGGSGFKGGKKKPMQMVNVERSKCKPCVVFNKARDKQLPLKGRELFYTDESVQDDGIKVFSPDDDQAGVAAGWIKCATWFVPADNVVSM